MNDTRTGQTGSSERILPGPEEQPPAFVDRILHAAIENNASDLYWIPSATGYDIRIRLNGVQAMFGQADTTFAQQCVTRLKVLSGCLTYKTHAAQDGVIRRDGNELRVATLPSSHGERVSIRLLLQNNGPQHLSDLGIADPQLNALKRLCLQESGLIILTGPTGSGKTTTIYAMIREILASQADPASIITLEDPIECDIPGITQVSVSDRSELQYADALRAALRQDVKTLVIGEMRDKDVMRATLDAAMTGHRVITTFHAGDIPSVYSRILHQGFEPFIVASAITGVVSQRLAAPEGEMQISEMDILEPTDDWRDLILSNPTLTALRAFPR